MLFSYLLEEKFSYKLEPIIEGNEWKKDGQGRKIISIKFSQ